MRIKRIEIGSFKNLKNLILEPKDYTAQVVIGQNASGKSNLIEALVAIFRHLDLAEHPPFDYQLEYTCRGHYVIVLASSNKITIEVKDKGSNTPKIIELDEFASKALEYLPAQVFAYYSGRNERLEQLFFEHQRQQYFKLRGKYVENQEGESHFLSEDVLLRRLFYCRNEHSSLILLTYLIDLERKIGLERKNIQGKSDDLKKEINLLREYLQISGIESALFVIQKPQQLPIEAINETDTELTELENTGDERFWNASGVMADFLSILWKYALAPIDEEINKLIDFRGYTQPQETIYLYLDKKRLIDAANEIGDVNIFFRQLEGVYMAGYLDEVRIQVRREGSENPIFYKELSEGEQQLMTVLGLLQFNRDDESLFLLDEPDTHLNPIWKYNYFSLMIDDVLASKEDFLNKNQLFITTHDPLMLGSLLKEQVLVLIKSNQGTTVEHPYQNPRGMGFSNLLRSEMFGLRSTIDRKTLDDLDERNRLIAKRSKSGLEPKETTKLAELQERLEELGFGREFQDPMYQLFIEKMYESKKQPIDTVLSKEQIDEQSQLAEKIVKELIHKEKMDELSDLARELKIQLSE
ncbi:AAA family ATPase [Anabaena sp. UHCC 0253]|uniref:AAA family ATPase n=1 Tax=Anabaena sp. UHCC 0253 TaxID=2590019 RepID=UPI0014462DA6|nr:AAA family ATPase [Anabaena sp. UHCC 0253]MTJ51969.1 AAA family ATPase [Anabaena sp. UHCC 0253]